MVFLTTSFTLSYYYLKLCHFKMSLYIKHYFNNFMKLFMSHFYLDTSLFFGKTLFPLFSLFSISFFDSTI